MRTEPSDTEIASYQANGFILLPGFLDDGELASLRTRTDVEVAAAAQDLHYSIRARGLADRDSEWASILRDRSLARFAALLEGLPSVRYAGDAISYSDPSCPPTPWHCGIHEGERPYETRRSISVQLHLDENTVQNKAMVFLPGTHKTAPFGKRFDSSPALDPTRTWESIFELSPEWRGIDPVAAEGPAGAALFWNTAVVHGSGSNMTARRRRYVGVSWIPSDVTWNGNAVGLSAETVDRLSPGDLLDAPEFPVVWPG